MKIRVFVFITYLMAFAGCSSSVYHIKAYPEGTLVRQQDYTGFTDVDTSGPEGISRKVMFLGKNDSVAFMAMKRGYIEDTLWIKKGSSPDITFNLKRIPDVSETKDYRSLLQGAEIYILPPVIDAVLHKGAGNLDRYETSTEDSERIYNSIIPALKNEFEHSAGKYRFTCTDLFDHSDTLSVPGEVLKYLFSLKPGLLKYYGIPPSLHKFYINGNDFNNLAGAVQASDKNDLMAIVHCRTIKPTGGRIAGNIILGLASATVPSSAAYDPEAFNLDSSTLLTVWYFHRGTGEVITIRQRALPYDLFSEKAQTSGMKELLKLFEDR